VKSKPGNVQETNGGRRKQKGRKEMKKQIDICLTTLTVAGVTQHLMVGLLVNNE
jgi:hypothetical protein